MEFSPNYSEKTAERMDGYPPGNFHSRTGEPVHSLNEILNVLEF